MNRNFKPQIESLETRTVMNAAWHEMVILGDVAVATTCDVATVERTDSTISGRVTSIVVDPIDPLGGWGASSYQYAFEGTYSNAAIGDLGNDWIVGGTGHDAPSASGISGSETLVGVAYRPDVSVSDDVLIDGKIITGENYDSTRLDVNDMYIFQSPTNSSYATSLTDDGVDEGYGGYIRVKKLTS